MMQRTSFLISFIVGWIFFSNLPFLSAQTTRISAEIRPRMQFRNGYGTMRPAIDSLDNQVVLVSQRTRLFVDYSNTKIRTRMTLQDVRTWGDTKQQIISDDNFSFLEAWGEWLISPEWSLKLGRQELVYDAQRIFGKANWTQQGRSHDLALLKYENEQKWHVHFGYAVHQDKPQLHSSLYTTNNYKNLQFLWLHTTQKKFSGSILALNQGFENIKSTNHYQTIYNQTIGGILKYLGRNWTLTTEYYSQLGRDMENKSLHAFNFRADVRWKIRPKFKLRLGIEQLSGTSQNQSSENHSFTPWFGANHRHNGWMDYFYGGRRHLNSVGLQDVYWSGTYESKKWNLVLFTHIFNSMANVISPLSLEKQANYLGTELDVRLRSKMTSELQLEAGYSQFFTSKTLEILQNGDAQKCHNWLYIAIIFKPEFFYHKK